MLILKGDRQRAVLWARHIIGVATFVVWVFWICDVPLWLYLLRLCLFWCGTQQAAFVCEHRAMQIVTMRRTAIVENRPFFGVLFSSQSICTCCIISVPACRGIRIPFLYRRHRNALIDTNGGLVYDGYLDVARRFLLKPHDDPRHHAT